MQHASRMLQAPDINSSLEAEALLAFVLNKPRSWLYAWPEKQLGDEAENKFRELVRQRASGIPVSHLTGEREFWGLPLKVTADTLIPRHETELLVETVLQRLTAKNARILELGTGTGAIAIALANEQPSWQITAVDISKAALAVARENAARHQVRIDFMESDWFECIPSRYFDLIISNPPYIEDNDPHLDRGDLRFEPRSALSSGPDGLDDIRRIIGQAPAYLAENGWLILEHGLQQGAAVRQLLIDADWHATETLQDYANRDRISLARPPVKCIEKT